MINQEAIETLSIADIERCNTYGKELEHGLRVMRTFPQGVTIFGSARVKEDSPYYAKARELGRLLANNGHTVVTGGGPGIMEAANRGAFEYGGRSIGFNITLNHEQHPNPYLTDMLEFKHFSIRKVILAMSSKVYAFFPGGFGTMDELTEIVVLMQEGKMPKMPVFLVGKKFWRPLDRFVDTRLIAEGMISEKDINIYTVTDKVEDIVKMANKIGHPKIKSNYYDGFDEAH